MSLSLLQIFIFSLRDFRWNCMLRYTRASRISQPSHGVPGKIIRAEQAIHARPAVIEQLQAPRLISTSSHPPENTSDPPLHLVLTFASLSLLPPPPSTSYSSNLPDLSVCPPFPFAAGAFEDTSAASEVLSHPWLWLVPPVGLRLVGFSPIPRSRSLPSCVACSPPCPPG